LVLPTLAYRAQPCSSVKLILRNNTNTILTVRRLVAGINQFEPHNDGTARETNMVIARSTLHILVANSWTPIKHRVRVRSSYFERLPRWIAQDFTHNEYRTHCSRTSHFFQALSSHIWEFTEVKPLSECYGLFWPAWLLEYARYQTSHGGTHLPRT
jgi:hypothetical protein